MSLRIQAGNVELLGRYAEIPIAFRVEYVLEPTLVEGGLGGIVLYKRPIASPYIKDYDVDEGPQDWARRFDMRHWWVLLALDEERPVGGATLAFDTPGIHMLAGRTDLTVLWDIRVQPYARGHGIGTALINQAADWARARGCRQLKIETQNVNEPACRFYAARGCTLGEINRYAYASEPPVAHEVMLVWYLDL
jgi:GNAT superfamily N-acetyltransferase